MDTDIDHRGPDEAISASQLSRILLPGDQEAEVGHEVDFCSPGDVDGQCGWATFPEGVIERRAEDLDRVVVLQVMDPGPVPVDAGTRVVVELLRGGRCRYLGTMDELGGWVSEGD